MSTVSGFHKFIHKSIHSATFNKTNTNTNINIVQELVYSSIHHNPMSQSLSLNAMYSEINHIDVSGVPGYNIVKKYCDPLEQIKQRQYAKVKKGEKSRTHQTKRGNFLDDESKLHKFCPGPGTYKIKEHWPEKQKLKKNIADKMTYIDEIIKTQKRQKFPAPGSYNLFKTQKQLDKQKKQLAQKKPCASDKINYLDEIQYEATETPGVGKYNPRVRAKTEYSYSKMNKKPEEWRKIHQEQSKKRPQKQPDMRTYNPVPSSYDLFSSLDGKKHNKNFLGKRQRLKTFSTGSGLPPTKYGLIQKWKGKDNAKKAQRHGLESISKGMSKSVYYN